MDLLEIANLARIGDVAEAASAWGRMLPQVGDSMKTDPAFAQRALPAMRDALDAMERKDWVAFADALEFGLK